jgi:hypothetical protein
VPDPWRLLGVEPGSQWEDVRSAYRRLAKELHPDVGGGDATRMAEINHAFRVLSAARAAPEAEPEPVPEPRPAPVATAVDELSFSIEQLPVDAFQSVLIVASFLGDPWVIDEPYELMARLDPPLSCRCHISLVPEAGGSLVTLTLHPLSRFAFPEPAAVRDAFVAELDALGT